jgi:hypothetical protein
MSRLDGETDEDYFRRLSGLDANGNAVGKSENVREVKGPVKVQTADRFPVRVRASKYPWDEWLIEGQITIVHQGTHFSTTPEIFRVTVTNTAKRKGWPYVVTNVSGPAVTFFVTKDAEKYRKMKNGEY